MKIKKLFKLVLGSYIRRAWDPAGRLLQWHKRPSARQDQRLLQRDHVQAIHTAHRDSRPGARHDRLHPLVPLRRALPPGQLRVRSKRSQQQLGEGPLHRGRRDHRPGPGRGATRGRELRLHPGFPADPLPGRWHRIRYGHPASVQDQGRVPGPDHKRLLRRAVPQSSGHSRRALQRPSVDPAAG